MRELMGDEEQSHLVSALRAALLVAQKARSADFGLRFQMLSLRDVPESALLEFRELQRVLNSIPSLQCFDHASQVAMGHFAVIDKCFLVEWLISRGQQVGAEQAVNDLNRYLGSDVIEITEVLTVDGLEVSEPIDLGYYHLVPWTSLPMTDTKWGVGARALLGAHVPTAAVVATQFVQPRHDRPWSITAHETPRSIEGALDVLRCATAVTGAGIRLLQQWFEPSPWAPWMVISIRFGVDSTVLPLPKSLDPSTSKRLAVMLERFENLDETRRTRLRIPMDRLNRACVVDLRSVDSAIELGISLESLFAPVKVSDGISLAVRTRATRFLGGSAEERRETFKLLKDVYDLRSLAVHAGRFDGGSVKKWKDESRVREVLFEGRSLIGRAIEKFVLAGEPEWDDFDIGPN